MRGIIMQAESVRGILDGTKTQTRRLVTPQPVHVQRYEWRGKLVHEGEHRMWCWRGHRFENIWDFPDNADRLALAALCPIGKVGDRLYVKESWRSWRRTCEQDGRHDDEDEACSEHCDQTYVAYQATPRIGYRPVPDKQRICYLDESTPIERNTELLGPWKSPLLMPRWASRIIVEITEVRVQRLQEISDDDARAEGVSVGEKQPAIVNGEPSHIVFFNYRYAFAYRWAALHRAESARTNPFVWALSFRRIP